MFFKAPQNKNKNEGLFSVRSGRENGFSRKILGDNNIYNIKCLARNNGCII